MSNPGLFAIVFFVGICGTVSGFWTIASIEICSVSFKVDENAEVVIPDFLGTYGYNSGTGGEFDQFLPFTNGNDLEFGWEDSGDDYEFKYTDSSTGDEVTFKLAGDDKAELFLQHLWGNQNECNCGMLNDASEAASGGDFQVGGDNDKIYEVVDFYACGTWIDEMDEDEIANNVIVDNFASPADTWACRDIQCIADEEIPGLTDLLEIKYRGFDVFGDEHCTGPIRHRNGQWKCHHNACEDGYFKFRTGSGDFEGLHKCRSCNEYFGDSCEYCQRGNGCATCTVEAFANGFTVIKKGAKCNLQYCAAACCETNGTNGTTSTPAAEPTSQPSECTDESISHSDGSGTVVYDCSSPDERAADSEAYGTRYKLPEPIWLDANMYGDCDNGVGYNCPSGADLNCATCNSAYTGNDESTGCHECKDNYFWYSNAVPCAPCSEFLGCDECMNGGDYGGGGCLRCVGSTSQRYDVEIGVYYCEENEAVDEDADSDAPVDPSDFIPDCIPTCDVTRGKNHYCSCGCNCTGCTIETSPLIAEAPYFCTDCHYDAGCDQCHDDNTDATKDYFMLTKFHPCANCYDTFGEGCEFCNDHLGCAQCATGYDSVVSNCCDDSMVYCVPASNFQ